MAGPLKASCKENACIENCAEHRIKDLERFLIAEVLNLRFSFRTAIQILKAITIKNLYRLTYKKDALT